MRAAETKILVDPENRHGQGRAVEFQADRFLCADLASARLGFVGLAYQVLTEPGLRSYLDAGRHATWPIKSGGDPGWTRTTDQQLRRLLL